ETISKRTKLQSAITIRIMTEAKTIQCHALFVTVGRPILLFLMLPDGCIGVLYERDGYPRLSFVSFSLGSLGSQSIGFSCTDLIVIADDAYVYCSCCDSPEIHAGKSSAP